MEEVRCPFCQNYYEASDKVFLTDLNTILHKDCFKFLPQYREIYDKGTYRSIIEKYDFFSDLLPIK